MFALAYERGKYFTQFMVLERSTKNLYERLSDHIVSSTNYVYIYSIGSV